MMELKKKKNPKSIDPEFQELIPPLSAGERSLLEESICRNGCRDALVVWNGILLDGHNRLEICKAHDIPFDTVEAPEDIKDRTDARVWIRNNQRARRNLTPAWMIELELGNKEDLEAKGKAKMSEAGEKHAGNQYTGMEGLSQNDNPPDSLPIEKHNTRNEIAKSAGVSSGQVGMAEQVRKKAPELWEHAKAGKTTINAAYKKTKRDIKRKEDSVAIKNKTFPTIDGKFKTILIDPPWDYGQLSLAGRGHPKYTTMSIEELKQLNINQYAENNCHLYVWTTNNFLYQALKLGEYWGFSYKTIITWVKPSMGLGSYFRNSTEHLLFFVKGNLPTRTENTLTHFEAPRESHSEKPEISYKIIEKNSYPAFLEYFARKKREGWVVWGNLDV